MHEAHCLRQILGKQLAMVQPWRWPLAELHPVLKNQMQR
jgi:hypothetical protein